MPGGPTVQERTMRVREVLMRAVQREISWIQAADILGISPRNTESGQVVVSDPGPQNPVSNCSLLLLRLSQIEEPSGHQLPRALAPRLQ